MRLSRCMLSRVGVCTLAKNNVVRATNDPTNANRDGCVAAFADGIFHSDQVWNKLDVDLETLRVHVPAQVAYAEQLHPTSAATPEFGSVSSCEGSHSMLGKLVIDLRGTPFAVAGDSSCACENTGSNSCKCTQWRTNGLVSAIDVTCEHSNRLCTVLCGGSGGGCGLENDYLQLEMFDTDLLNTQCPTGTHRSFRTHGYIRCRLPHI